MIFVFTNARFNLKLFAFNEKRDLAYLRKHDNLEMFSYSKQII